MTGGRSISDDGVFNAIVAQLEPTSSGSVVTVPAVYDTDPTSDTMWDGPFGKAPGFLDTSQITSPTQAVIAQRAQLRNTVGAARSVTFTMTPHPGLEVGDLVGVTFPDGTYEQHLVDTLSMPLNEADPIQASTRASRDVVGVS